jgi:rare lipoprotein A
MQILALFPPFIAPSSIQQGKVAMKRVKRAYLAPVLAVILIGISQQAFAECGVASTYSSGRLTANGERYNHMGISAAHKSLPFGTRVLVRNQRTGRSIVVRINDRGPYVRGRIIDLSTGAKNAFGMDGLAPVCISVVSYGHGRGEIERAAFHPEGHEHLRRHRRYARVTGRHRRAHYRGHRFHRHGQYAENAGQKDSGSAS